MILYWLILAALLAAVVLSIQGAAAARQAGSAWWLRFHTRLAVGATVAAILFVLIGAPIAHKL